jgi:hypothetical protein
MNSPFRKVRDRLDDFTASVDSAAVNLQDGTRALVACAFLAVLALCVATVALLR